MINRSIKAIIFDLGNVVIDFDHTIAARKICGLNGKTTQEVYRLFFDSGLTALFEEGKVTPGDFFREVKKLLSLKIDYASFLPIWNEIFFLTERNRQVYNLAKNLKGSYRIALLSNINILHYNYLKNNFSIFDVFEYIMLSFELGRRKPHPLIYQKTLEMIGVEAKEVFYTDDRPELIASAKELGLAGTVFTGIASLKKNLLSIGVQVN
ncbi:HAD family phosphatase [bacterium]|nr:MAG: HAD family phosphatase [bacterium]